MGTHIDPEQPDPLEELFYFVGRMLEATGRLKEPTREAIPQWQGNLSRLAALAESARLADHRGAVPWTELHKRVNGVEAACASLLEAVIRWNNRPYRVSTAREHGVEQLLRESQDSLADVDQAADLLRRASEPLRQMWRITASNSAAQSAISTIPTLPPPPVDVSDGPFAGDGFRFKGKQCRGLNTKQYNLLSRLWDTPRVDFSDLAQMWEKDTVSEGAVRSFVTRLGRRLLEEDISLGLRVACSRIEAAVYADNIPRR